MEPLAPEEIEPGSFDLVVPDNGVNRQHQLETLSDLLFSKEHLAAIFGDFGLQREFTEFVAAERPEHLKLLTYHLNCTKALKAMKYANAITSSLERLDGHSFAEQKPPATTNDALQKSADAAFEALARDVLPAYITHVWTRIVSVSIKRRVTGTLPAQLRESSEGLAEVFCLTDPSRKDNPIVFASEEFYKTTQYGTNYAIGRNCRFLQGPRTNPFSVRRIRDKLEAGVEHCETFLNYRRDGSPFMNLLMMAPLYDNRGVIRYFIGAQVDVSGLVKTSSGLEGFKRLVEENHVASKRESQAWVDSSPESRRDAPTERDSDLRQLCEMFTATELESVRTYGGGMFQNKHHGSSHAHESVHGGSATSNWNRPRLLIKEESYVAQGAAASPTALVNGQLTGVYTHYLLVRPYPNLRILFASPSLRVPGILQSPFLNRIGGSDRVRDGLTQALANGQGVTAKIRWLAKPTSLHPDGRPRWIHCTPLLGSNGAIGVWMVVLVDDDVEAVKPRLPQAPPVNPPMRVHGPREFQPEDGDNLSFSGLANGTQAATEGDVRTFASQSRPTSRQM